MSTILLFHAALGLNKAVLTFAEYLRADGHEVHTPDLFDGETFSNLEMGIVKRETLGIPELIDRAWAAASQLPEDIYYAGFSMGAASAQMLAGTRPGAKGCILMHAALPLQLMQIENWPAGVPVQFHATKNDPWVENDVITGLETQIPSMTSYWYEGDQHLFADTGSQDYVGGHAKKMLVRVREFLK